MIPRKHNMMGRMLRRAARARREHGMALLFTLCILSMALITAMIFSSMSSTSRKVASAYVDSSAARILADGVVMRAALALMQSDNASYACSNYKTCSPNGNANEYSSDWIWKIEKSGVFSFNDGPLRFDKTSYYNRDDGRCPSWEYVYCKNNYGDTTNERITGRYAYVAIGMNDQLNPNAIGRLNYGDFDNTLFQKRLGRWTCEPQFNFKSSRNHWNYEAAISPTRIREKYPTEGWTDLDLFINDMIGSGGSGGGSSADKQLKMMADQYFDVTNQGEYNKFRFDGKPIGDLTQHGLDSGESYRFPLIRNDWESISLDAVKNAIPWFSQGNTSQANVNQTVANLINYNASVNRPPVTDNDNWLGGTPTYTGNKRTPYINEVQADVSIGGNLGMRLQERYLEDPNNPTSWKWRVWYTDCTYNHEITLNVETVNMYPLSGAEASIPVQAPILIGEITYEYSNPNGDNPAFWVPMTVRFDASTSWEVVQSGSPAGYNVYTFMLDSGSVGSVTTPRRGGYDRPMGHEGDFYENIRVRNVKVSLDRIVLRDNAGRNADLSLMPSLLQNGRSFLTTADGEQVADSGDISRHFYFDAQVNDPRHNLGREQWTATFSERENEINATVGTRNSVINLGAYHDNERVSDPVYSGNNSISTAYIRHGQMISLWELGAIHRGTPWQTINLKCGTKNGTRMEAYQNGDGHLLDQIALVDSRFIEEPVVGMINLNCVANFGGSSAPFVFKSLFTNFPIYQTYANMNSGSPTGTLSGDSVDSDKSGSNDADAYAKELSEAVTYATTQGNLQRRTAVFPVAYGSGNQMEMMIPKNVPDAQAEEIFSRVVNLLKWNKQQVKRATVLVLAQTIRDVGGPTLMKTLSDRDLDLMRDAGFLEYSSGNISNKSTAPTGVSAASIRSAFASRATAYKQYDNFYDEITGEAKIIVRLEWDESANDNKGAWKVTRKEYAE